MSGKTVDVDLRVRARNLSKSTLKEIIGDVESLTDAQAKQAKAADLASRSMKELLSEQQRAAALARELTSRRGLLQRYIDEREEIDALSKKLVELTDARKRAAAATDKMDGGKGLKQFDQEVADTEKRLNSFITKATKTEARLTSLGVEVEDVAASMALISSNIGKASAAYDKATSDVVGYSAAIQRANDIQAEAVRRTNEEAEAKARVAAANRSALQATGGRASDLSALRQDIEQRSAQARATEIAAEAQRRLRVEQELEASSLARNNAAVREAVQLLEARRQRQAALEDVFGRQLTLQEREQRAQAASNGRRERLVALLQTERGQRLLGLEAMRRETTEAERGAAAKGRLADSTRRAAAEQSFFADTGRKSLSVYQRIRGQVLGLAAAYVGIYQVIGTVSSAIEAVNRNQALQIGLLTANSGDAKQAASDYKFLREEADRLGLVFDEVAPKYANMAIAGREVGLSAKQTRDLFTDVATSVSAGNLSLDDSEGVFRAIVQIMGKARVQAEELRGQLGDRLPGAVAAFAKANNIALTDLDALLKSGELGVDELIRFADGYAKQYAPVMEQATTRLQASINRARNAYNDWLRDLLNGDSQSKLKQAFSKIEEFFEGEKGQEFAEKLGKALNIVVDAFIWLADNVDVVTQALKILLAVQVIKFGIDTAESIRKLGEEVVALSAALRAASTNVGGAAGAMSRLKLAAVGVAGILLGITAAINAQSNALRNTSRELSQYSDLLSRIGRRQGKARAQSFDEAKQNVADIRGEIEETEAQAKKLQGFVDQFKRGGVSKLVAGVKGTLGLDGLRDLGVGPLSKVEELQARVNTLNRQALNLRRSETEELEIQSELLAKDMREQEQAAKDTGFTPSVKKEKEKKERAAKGPDPEAEARRREAAEDAAAKKIIDLQDEIAQAKVEKGVRTDEQIEANFNATMERITLDIQKKRLEMEALQRQTAASGADNTTKFTTMDGLLGQLEASLRARAEEERVTAMIELRQKSINDLISERDDKIRLQNVLMETGQQGALTTQQNVNTLQDDYNTKIRAMIAEFMAFLMSLDPEGDLWKRLGLDKVLRDLQLTNAEVVKLNASQKFLAKWGETIAAGFTNVFMVFGKGIADAVRGTSSWTDAIKNAWDAFRTFAADFLQQIAQMIIQAIILQAIQNAINGTSGGYGQAISAAFGAAHTGGVVRRSDRIGTNPQRRVDPSVFIGAQRFHEGGMPGLKQNEVAAILKKGEEVVTENDPRHISNAGAGGSSPVELNVVNTIDPTAVISAGIRSGSKQVVNDMTAMMRSNRNEFKTALGV